MHTFLIVALAWLALDIAVAVLLIIKPLPARRRTFLRNLYRPNGPSPANK